LRLLAHCDHNSLTVLSIGTFEKASSAMNRIVEYHAWKTNARIKVINVIDEEGGVVRFYGPDKIVVRSFWRTTQFV